jgi:hypothetical protein
MGGFAGLRKRQGKSVRLCWAGNRRVRERGQVGESQAWGSGRKPGHQGGGWWVSGEDALCALIRAVCTDLRGPAENPDLLSYDWGFLRSFREQMRGFHDLLRQKPSSLFNLVGRSSSSIVEYGVHCHRKLICEVIYNGKFRIYSAVSSPFMLIK